MSRVEFATLTNNGGRPVNEDSIAVYEKDGVYCFVLCDGLGGHGMGDLASQLVVQSIGQDFVNNYDPKSFMANAVTNAQNKLIAEQKVKHATDKMKTTCVLTVVDGKKVKALHVGDSRLYYFSKGKVLKRTLDHSIPQMLVLSKEIKESEIRHHSQRSLILRVMGTPWETPQYELEKDLPARKCQAMLLCSDGFWELILEEDMCRLLQTSTSPQMWLQEMEKIVCANGKDKDMDNYSAVAVWITK